MDELGKLIAHELEMISQAPVAFMVAIIMLGILMWKFMGSQYKNRLEDAASRNQLLQDRIDDYKEKLSGATPDEAKARLDALEARLETMAPPKLRPEQRQVMLPHLDAFRGSGIIISTDAGSANAGQLSRGMQAAFNSAGWIVATPTVMGVGNPPPTGVGLRVNDPARLTPVQQAIRAALDAAGVTYDLQRGVLERAMRPGMPEAVAEILFTQKLED